MTYIALTSYKSDDVVRRMDLARALIALAFGLLREHNTEPTLNARGVR